MKVTRSVARRIMVGSFAVVACMLAVACANKKASRNPVRQAAPTTPPPAPTTPPQVPPPAQQAPPVPRPSSGGPSELEGQTGVSAQEQVKAGDATAGDDGKVRVTIYQRDLTEEELRDSTQITAAGVTGENAADDSTLTYTGAGHDTFVALLKDRLDHVEDREEKRRNLEFAREIGLTRVVFDWPAARFSVVALLERNGKRQYYYFRGRFNSDLTGSFGSATELPNITGDFACMDLNAGPGVCRNMRLRFRDIENENEPRTAYVIVRDTPASFHLDYRAPEFSGNAEYRRLVTILAKTADNTGRPVKLNTASYLNLTTSETVNGSATFMITMRVLLPSPCSESGAAEDTTRWTGPLVTPTSFRGRNISVSPEQSGPLLGACAPIPDPNNGHISDTIYSTALLGNDGAGTLKLGITVRSKMVKTERETFVLTVRRQQNQVKYLNL